MTSNQDFLRKPQFAVALIWFPDDTRRPGEPAGPDHPHGPSEPPPPPVTPEDTELVRSLTGLTPVELVTRLQDIAASFERDPGALRAELLRIAGGDEIEAGHLMQLIRAALPGADEGETKRAGEEEGRVIPLPLHVPGSDEDEDGDEP
jgi:hypothetical protein